MISFLFRGREAGGGFTLVELLVAVSTLTVVLLLVLSLAGSTATLTTQTTGKISADAQNRQALDRLASDLNRMILRDDLPLKIEKSVPDDDGEEEQKINRNDAIAFYAQADGYEGDRGVAKLGYRLFGGSLQRGAEGTFWEEAEEEDDDPGDGEAAASEPVPQLPFGETTLTPIHESHFEPVGGDVFRFELAFLMQDGSIKASTSRFFGANPGEQVRAVIVAVAALDQKTRAMMESSGSLEELAALLPDAVDSSDILSAWQAALEGPAFTSGDESNPFPVAVRSAIRVQQRYLFVGP